MRYHVFLSYSSLDYDTAKKIVDSLESKGLSCFLAKRDIPPGSNWPREIVNALKDSAAYMVLLTENSVTSKHVESELSFAFDNKLKIIPIILQKCALTAEFEYLLKTTNWLDATEGNLEAHIQRAYEIIVQKSVDDLSGPGPKPVIKKKKKRLWIPALILFLIISGVLYNGWQNTKKIETDTAEFLQKKQEERKKAQEYASIDFSQLEWPDGFSFMTEEMICVNAEGCFPVNPKTGDMAKARFDGKLFENIGHDSAYPFTGENLYITSSNSMDNIYVIDGKNQLFFHYSDTVKKWRTVSFSGLIDRCEIYQAIGYESGIVIDPQRKNKVIPILFYDTERNIFSKIVFIPADGFGEPSVKDISSWKLRTIISGGISLGKNDYYFGLDQNKSFCIIDTQTWETVEAPLSLIRNADAKISSDPNKSPVFFSKDKKYVCYNLMEDAEKSYRVEIINIDTGEKVWEKTFEFFCSIFFTGDDEITYYDPTEISLCRVDLGAENKTPTRIMDFETINGLFQESPSGIWVTLNYYPEYDRFLMFFTGEYEDKSGTYYSLQAACFDLNGENGSVHLIGKSDPVYQSYSGFNYFRWLYDNGIYLSVTPHDHNPSLRATAYFAPFLITADK